MRAWNCIDLFAGAGGLSEGFTRAGFQVLAHVEMDKSACATLRTRLIYHYLKDHEFGREIYAAYLKGEVKQCELYAMGKTRLLESVLQTEISWETIPHLIDRIDALIGMQPVDVVLGGPPCQAYSVVGRARDPHAMRHDRRNFLYQYYGEFLRRYRPAFFIFENVTGLLSAGGQSYFAEMQALFRYCGYALDWRVLNAADFGVVQTRKRVFLIGKRTKAAFQFKWPAPQRHGYEVMRDLFADLPALQAGEAPSFLPYAAAPTAYLAHHGLRNGFEVLSQHTARAHRPEDLEIYRLVAQQPGLKYDELPAALRSHRNSSTFLDRFKVVNPSGLSHTIVAHLAKDGHHFIHPDPKQNRSISVREAARIQSFPDDYFFEGGRSAAFRQIGNAVPPLVAEAIGRALRKEMEE